MKKLIIFLLFSQILLAQESIIQKNSSQEFKFNALYLIVGAAEISYEFNINEESSAGISGFISFDEDFGFEHALTGYYRFYFGSKPAAGFFAEGFSMINTVEHTIYDSILIEDRKKMSTDLALGISIGGKFITKKGLVAEIFGGIGRNLGGSDSYEFVPRFGINIGKRF